MATTLVQHHTPGSKENALYLETISSLRCAPSLGRLLWTAAAVKAFDGAGSRAGTAWPYELRHRLEMSTSHVFGSAERSIAGRRRGTE